MSLTSSKRYGIKDYRIPHSHTHTLAPHGRRPQLKQSSIQTRLMPSLLPVDLYTNELTHLRIYAFYMFSRRPFSIPQFTSLHHTSLNPTNTLTHSHINAFIFILPIKRIFVSLQFKIMYPKDKKSHPSTQKA